MIYIRLFLAFVSIGAFSFGGGYASMPLIQSQVVERYGWISLADFADLVTIAEMTPGPIAVNAATFVGNQVAGIPGAAAATAGCILPSCLFVTALAWLYLRFRQMAFLQKILESLRPAVVSMILTSGLAILAAAFFRNGQFSLADRNLNLRAVVYFLAALFFLRRKKASPIRVMFACGAAEVICQALFIACRSFRL